MGVRQVLLALALVLFACDETTVGPSPPPPPPTTSVISPPPRVDQPFSWDYYQGFTAFALGHPGQSEADITLLYAEAMSHGWNTARVCSETEFWSGDGYPTKPRDSERLTWLLDTIARIPGAQVLLIGNCTLKRQIPLDEQLATGVKIRRVPQDIEAQAVRWAEQVAQVASEFQNVAIETHNEFDNCRSRDDWGGSDKNCPGKQTVNEHIKIYRQHGIQYVTADDSICYGPDVAKTYQFRLANIGAMPADFHPCRDKGQEPWDPDQSFLERIRAFNGDFVLSETVALTDYSGNCGGARTCDQSRIQRFVDACAAVPGCAFTFHSENLLAGVPPSWWPEAN